MSPLELIFLGLFLFSLVCLIVVIVYYKFYRQFTRERFAFKIFVLLASVTSSIIFILISPKHSLGPLVETAGSILGTPVADFDPSISDKLLAVGVLCALMYFGLRLHRQWPGAISVREHEAQLAGIKT